MSTTNETDWWDRTTGRINAWHADYFPDATTEQVALKVCEEAGELARAVGNLSTGTRPGVDWEQETRKECGDVFGALVAFARVAGFDLRTAIEAKVGEVTARRRDSDEENNR